MRRLGDVDPDSGHPTPREDEEYMDDGSGSPVCSHFLPLTSTPLAENRRSSVQRFFEDSERNQMDVEEKEALVASVKQLIQTTEKNRKLVKENEKILNQSHQWNEEKSILEKQIQECNALVETLQSELKEKCGRIELLELRITDLLKTVTEHPSEEGFEASEELVSEKQDACTQCERNVDEEEALKNLQMTLAEMEDRNRFLDAENNELKCKLDNLTTVVDEVVNLRGLLEDRNQKVTLLEGENRGLQKKKEELMKNLEAKTEELIGMKEKYKRLEDEVEALRDENAGFAELRLRNEDFERLLTERDRNLEELRMHESEMKSRISSCEREIEELKTNDKKMKSIVSEKTDEADKLREECVKLREMSSKLTEENVFSSVLSEELNMRLSRANAELEELRLSVMNEKQAREAAEDNLRRCSDLEMKVRERSVRIDDLITANEKMSQELEFLRQAAANSSSKEEMEQLSSALTECRKNLECAIAENKTLMAKEVASAEQIAKLESLRYELKCRDEIVAELRAVESKLQDALVEKSAEITDLGHRLDKINEECDRVRGEFHVFQELAEQQYCQMMEEKRGQIEALSSRLAQLEDYPGQFVSIDENSCAKWKSLEKAGKFRDHILPPIHELAENDASNSAAIAVSAVPEVLPSSPEKCDAETQISKDFPEEVEGVLPINRLITSVENSRDCDFHPSTSHMQDELKRLLTCAKYEQRSNVIDTAVVRYLKECQQHLADTEGRVREELRALCDDKQILEKKMNSEKLKWSIEREDLQLQLDRFRRQADQVTCVQKEKMSITSELNAAKIQIEQYRVKLRKQSEELEAISAEKENVTHLMVEFQKLDQESQEEIKKANVLIDKLEGELQNAQAELEKERREVISLKDEHDLSMITIQHLKGRIADLDQKVIDLERQCEKLLKTERYNQKTIQLVCESFWEREEFVNRLRRRSYERRKLIEHFVDKVGEIIASFKGDSDPVDSMQATIEKWKLADVHDEMDHDSKTRALKADVEELGSGDQLSTAYKRVLSSSRKKH
ncbi:hypothetical protein GCK32_003023 [Trichostrongylus colubriformis]|uniref:Uncharacterized protein n=1 Tax=Trichostrongylus colubriformis TaxID=6319 RepID=A0AAN8IVL0_TRICO